MVDVAELTRAVLIALGVDELEACLDADRDLDGSVSVAELVSAVRHALEGCSVDEVQGCNLSKPLCERQYDTVSYPTTHNSMSNFDEGWSGANQNHGILRQLSDGVRGLMLDTHYFDLCSGGPDDGRPCPFAGCGGGGECVRGVYLCHGTCLLGSRPLVDGLSDIRRFLELRPREVVTIIFESYISAEDTARSFAESGLLPYAWAQPPQAPWPTLSAMIDARRPLVVMTDRDGGAQPWYHDVWVYAWETPFSFESADEFTCAMNRGKAENRLFILNHFLTQIVGAPRFAEQVNFNPLFLARALECRQESGRQPNFVTVDFYDIGDLFQVVDVLNGLVPGN